MSTLNKNVNIENFLTIISGPNYIECFYWFCSESVNRLCLYKHEIFVCLCFIIVIEYTYKYYTLEKNDFLNRIDKISEDKLKLDNNITILNRKLKYYKQKNNNKENFSKEITSMINKCKDVIVIGNEWRHDISFLESEIDISKRKLVRIKAIMTDSSYTNEERLLYSSNEWSMKELIEKADKMNLPDMYWGNKSVLGYVIRLAEQLRKINDTVESKVIDIQIDSNEEREEKTNVLKKLYGIEEETEVEINEIEESNEQKYQEEEDYHRILSNLCEGSGKECSHK
jgi:hypothetical protein